MVGGRVRRWLHGEYERWLDRGFIHVLGRIGSVANWLLTFGPVVAGAILYITHRGHPGAVWWLVAGLAVTLFFVGLSALRYRIKFHRSEIQLTQASLAVPSPPKPIDPVVAGLLELRGEGVLALRTFQKSESDLYMGENFGKPPPQGRSYDTWHQKGARELREWLDTADDRALEFVPGGDAFMSTQRQTAPYKAVPHRIREDYHDLWLNCAHRLDWLSDEIQRRDPTRYPLGHNY